MGKSKIKFCHTLERFYGNDSSITLYSDIVRLYTQKFNYVLSLFVGFYHSDLYETKYFVHYTYDNEHE